MWSMFAKIYVGKSICNSNSASGLLGNGGCGYFSAQSDIAFEESIIAKNNAKKRKSTKLNSLRIEKRLNPKTANQLPMA